VTSVVLLAGIIIVVQYLSLPLPSTQPLTPSPIALPLPDKPSIIVLPFTNMSEEAKQEYFSDGITEDLTSSLSRIPSLFVISRHSAFTYKGKSVKVQEVSKEMGVRYVLAGSVRRAGERVRVTAQLIDAPTGEHVWSERYDRLFTETLAVQDEIVQKIMTTLKLQLTLEEQGYLMRKRTDNLEAYDSYLRGLASFFRTTKEDNLHARQLFEKAIILDPQYAEAYARLGFTYFIEGVWHWSQDPQTLEQGLAMGQRAVTLNDSLSMAHALLGVLYVQKKQYEQALAASERAIAFDPNNAESYARRAAVLNMMGRSEEALPAAEHAMRLNPRGNVTQLIALGATYFFIGRYPEAIATLTSLLARNPNHLEGYMFLSASYLQQWMFQQEDDAQALTQALAAAQRVLALSDAYPVGHRLVGAISLCQKQYELAVAEMEQAIALDPNDARAYAALAETLGWMGRTEEALQMVEEALRRKPALVDDHLGHIGAAYLLAGKPAEAITPLTQFLSRYPHILAAHLGLVMVYSELGKDPEAQAAAAEVLRINPKFSLEVHKQRMPIKDLAVLEQHIAALRKVGLK
jgi:TolB-like protein/Tfp pilus assembly protein PilF